MPVEPEQDEQGSGTADFAVAAAKGAAAGGAAGATLAVAKKALTDKGARRLLGKAIGVLVVAVLALGVGLGLAASSVFGGDGSSQSLEQAKSADAVTKAGIEPADLATLTRAAQGARVPWQLLAALYSAQKYTATGLGPFKAAQDSGVPSGDDLAVHARWLAAKLSELAGDTAGLDLQRDLAAYARLGPSGEVTYTSADLHERTIGEPWVSALAGLPLTGADQAWAKRVLDQALYYRLGAAGPGASWCLPFASGGAVGATAQETQLDAEQLANAERLIGIARKAGVGTQGVVVVLVTALQESSLRNLPGGDRDSLGFFQQRPSQGWGTRVEILDPTKATLAFLGMASHTSNPGLTDIAGWQSLPVGDAAQKVQRSAFPDEYAKWEGAARWLEAKYPAADPSPSGSAGAPSEQASAGSCGFFAGGGPLGECPATLGGIESHLQPAAINLGRCLKSHFEGLFDPIGGWRPCDSIAADHPSGLAIDAMVPDYSDPARIEAGTKAAEWLMANAQALNMRYLIWRQKKWNAEVDQPMPWTQWRGMEDRGSDTQNHFDHIHVTVYGPEIAGWRCGGGTF